MSEEEQQTYPCLECGYRMHSSTRQLCGKLQCDNLAGNYSNEESELESSTNEESKSTTNEPEYYYAGEFISLSGIIKGGLQFESLDAALQWRTRRLQEISDDPEIDTNFYEFPFLVIQSQRTIIGSVGNIFRY
jgi:hypothetical protein